MIATRASGEEVIAWGNFVCNDLNDCTWGFWIEEFWGNTGTGVDIELGIGADREILVAIFWW